MEVLKDKETKSETIYLTEKESAMLIVALEKINTTGLDLKYQDFVKELKNKLWNS